MKATSQTTYILENGVCEQIDSSFAQENKQIWQEISRCSTNQLVVDCNKEEYENSKKQKKELGRRGELIDQVLSSVV